MDIYSLLMEPEEADAQAKAQAMAQALRRQQAIGTLAALTGDKVLGQLGQQFSQNASQGQERLAGAGETRLRRTLEKQRMQAEEAHREKQLGLQERGVAVQEAQANDGRWSTQFLPGTGIAVKTDAKTGEQVMQELIPMDKLPKDKSKQNEVAEGLRKELMGNPVVKQLQEVQAGWDKVQSAVTMSKTHPNMAGAADIGLVFGVMKILDPTSSVRSDERADAKNAGGVPDYIRAQWNALKSGDSLSEDTREAFKKLAEQAYGAQKNRYDPLAKEYGRLAEKQGLDPADVVLNLGFGGGQPSSPAGAPAAGLPTYEQARPGDVYLAPDGSKRRKKG